MKKKLIGLLVCTSVMGFSLAALSIDKSNNVLLRGNSEDYLISMSDANNVLNTNDLVTSGDAYIKTVSNNSVNFSFANIVPLKGAWQRMKPSSSFQNITPIRGIKSISITTDNIALLKIYYGVAPSILNNSGVFANGTYNFNNSYPNYFKVVNESNEIVDINALNISYTCIDSYSEGSIAKCSSIELGHYPQTRVNDDSVKASLTEMVGTLPLSSDFNGWNDFEYYMSGTKQSFSFYKDVVLDGFKYRAIYFTDFRPLYTSSSSSMSQQRTNGYNTNVLYFFRFEPISWKVLDVSESTYLLLSNVVLDSQDYNTNNDDHQESEGLIHAHNYYYSDIRSWLNSAFYSSAFNKLDKNIVSQTLVDNSFETTSMDDELKECVYIDTLDYVFLPSHNDLSNEEYGFNDYLDRRVKCSDYAYSQGISATNAGGTRYSPYLTRTPSHDYADFTTYTVGGDGTFESLNFITSTATGVRPMIKITL